MAKSTTSSKPFSFLRWLGWLVLLCVSLAILLPIAAYFFFDPNDFRPQIATFITHKTGLPLQIEGKIDFKLYPTPQLNVQNITLPQPDQNGHFVKVAEIGFEIPLRELLQANLKIESLLLKDVDIHLMKYANGSTNWEKVTEKFSQTRAEHAKAAEKASEAAPTSKKRLAFAIESFAVQNAKITYEDKTQNQLVIVNKVQLKQDDSKSGEYPIQGEVDFTTPMEKSKMIKGHGDFKGKAFWTPKAAPRAQLQTTLSVHLPEPVAGMQDVKATMDTQANLDQSIVLKNIHVQSGALQATGNCTIPMDTAKPITFNLVMNQLNLDKLPQKGSSSTHAAASTKSIQLTAAATSSNAGRALSGDIRINQLISQHLTLHNVQAAVKKNGNIVKLNPLTADLYQGRLNAQVTKNLNDPSGAAFQGKISNIQIQPLLQDLKQVDKLSGKASVDFNLSQTGQGLNGTTNVQIQKGTIQGIDVKYYLALAQSLLKKEATTQPNTKMTPFDSLTATLKIHQNIIYNNDLQILSEDFKANGDGSVDLNNQTLEYKLLAVRQYHDNQEHPNAYPLAIRIKGPWQHPHIEPDMDVYLKKAVENEVKKQVNKQVEKHLGKQLGKILGGSDNSGEGTTPSGDNAGSTQDQIKDKVQEGLDKGIKKIFKLP